MTKVFEKGARALVAMLLLTAAGGARAEERYWITELGTAESYPDYWSARLNESGEIAANMPGTAALFTGGSATMLGRAGASSIVDLNDLGQVLGGDEQGFFLYDAGEYASLTGMTWVSDLSNGSVVAGTTSDPNDPFQYGHAALWYEGAVVPVYELLRPLGEAASETLFVNSYGEAVGYWYDAVGNRYPFFFYDGALVSDLGPITELLDSKDGRFTALNENGMVAGFYTNAEGGRVLAYHWFGYSFDIGTGGADGLFEQVHGINDRNDVFGDTWGPLGGHGFIFTYEDQLVHETGSLGGDSCTHGINNLGDMVGHSNGPGNVPYLGDERYASGAHTLFTGGKAYDLNALVPSGSGFVLAAYNGKINDRGQLLLGAFDANGVERPILLTPLPVSAATFTGTPGAQGWFASNVTVKLTATDPSTGVREVRYRVDSASNWTTVSGASATFTISQAGTHRISHYAVDTKGHAEAVKTATVSINKGGVVINELSLREGEVGSAFSAQLTASGGSSPYSFRLTAGALPAGLTLRSDGLISGTPTAVGTSWFQVQATDRRGVSSRSYLSIVVYQPLVPSVPPIPYGGGLIGLGATGGKPPYAWSLAPGSELPPGVTLHHATLAADGTTPEGEYPVTFLVTDDRGVTVAATVALGFYAPINVTGYNWYVYVRYGTQVENGTDPYGAPLDLTYSATGGTGSYVFSFSSDTPTPEGLVIDPTTGRVSGTVPPTGAWLTVGVVATDSNGVTSWPLQFYIYPYSS